MAGPLELFKRVDAIGGGGGGEETVEEELYVEGGGHSFDNECCVTGGGGCVKAFADNVGCSKRKREGGRLGWLA